MYIDLPKEVAQIISMLEEKGFEAWAVGGCIRDSVLKREPGDWDITTDAEPEEIKAVFRRTVDTGIKHGTVTVLIKDKGFEVTTFRLDGKYEDARHPSDVTFTKSLKEDLKRRDFTINAMAYNSRRGLVDEFGGLSDLEHRLIRAVGDPGERFSEDALRIMRAVRFSAQLNFTIEERTLSAIPEKAESLRLISAERIREELLKLLASAHPEKLLTLSETGITAVILPEFDRELVTPQNNKHHQYNVGIHTIETLKYSVTFDEALSKEDITVLRLTMLLHDMGKPDCHTRDEDGTDHFKGHSAVSVGIAESVLRRLKFDNATIKRVCTLVRYHDHRQECSEANVRRTAAVIGRDLMPLWFMVRRCDTMGQSVYIREEKLKATDRFEETYERVLQNGDCLTIGELAVNGNDLIACGMKPGRELGTLLKRMLDLVLEDPSLNTRERLLALCGGKQEAAGGQV
ncbi:MAG TPA: CCA tRNA nucleotidyltransferase [Lachnospiraceae bacterium]|nr:CCA tRNA nucleotidyltransferase [Lachnospiraceae bacterium]